MQSQAYHLDATLDFKRRKLDVVETLEWTNTTSGPATSINLSVLPAHLGSFTLSGPITQNGTVVESSFAEHDTNLRIPFAEPVAPQQTTTLVIPFELIVRRTPEALTGWDSTHADLTAAKGVIQFGHWFPVWSTVHGFHAVGDPQVTFVADSITLDLTSTRDLGVDAVAASGSLQPGATANHWRFEAHNVRDFAFIVAPRFQVVTERVSCGNEDTIVQLYTVDVDVERPLRLATEALAAYGEWFGCYPYPVFTIAQAPGDKFSLEFPMVTFMSADAMRNPTLVHHEVAHQWWYGIVGNDQMNEPWIDEAFAEYSARLLDDEPIEYCYSRGGVTSSVYEFQDWMECSYYSSVYLKGAAFLDDVRRRMGWDSFVAALRDIVDTYRYEIASTDGVLAILVEHSERGLRSLFRDYGFDLDADPAAPAQP